MIRIRARDESHYRPLPQDIEVYCRHCERWRAVNTATRRYNICPECGKWNARERRT